MDTDSDNALVDAAMAEENPKSLSARGEEHLARARAKWTK